MTKTTKTTAAVAPITAPVHVAGAPDGILRVFVPGEIDTHAARSTACKIHGGVTVGRTPVGRSATLNGTRGHVFDFAPVAKRTTAPAPVPTAGGAARRAAAQPIGKGKGGKVATPQDLRRDLDASELLRRVLAGDVLPTDALAMLAGAPAAPASKGKGKTERPAFLGGNADATCKTCSDHGVVRAAGKRAGGAYKTANGAAVATANGNSVPCPSHVASKGKGKGKRSA